MTNLEALQASLIYPVEEAKLKKALFDRELNFLEDYIISAKRLMDLTVADILVMLINAPAISEGGFSMSLSDKQSLMKTTCMIGCAKYLSRIKTSETTIHSHSHTSWKP